MVCAREEGVCVYGDVCGRRVCVWRGCVCMVMCVEGGGVCVCVRRGCVCMVMCERRCVRRGCVCVGGEVM